MTRSILRLILNFFNSFTSSTFDISPYRHRIHEWERIESHGWLGHTNRHIFITYIITHTSLYQWSNLTHWTLAVIWRGLSAHKYMDIWQQWWAISNIGIITLSFIYCAVYIHTMSIDTSTHDQFVNKKFFFSSWTFFFILD